MSHLEIDHLTKVEGHAKLSVDWEGRKVKKARLEVFESSRAFEALVLGRQWKEIPSIVQRICGFCSPVHSITSIKAIESAFDIEPSRQSEDLRRLLLIGGHLYSHLAHLYFMVLPDWLGLKSSFRLAEKRKEEFKKAHKAIKNACEITRLLGGRAVHPVNAEIGGFSKFPSPAELESVTRKFRRIENFAIKLAKLFASFDYPEFKTKADQFALESNEYQLYEGKISSLAGCEFYPEKYEKIFREHVVSYSTAKHVLYKGKSFFVGALPRLNLNLRKFEPKANQLLEENKVKFPLHSPYLNNLAQAIELVHFCERGIKLVRKLLGKKQRKKKVKPCKGVGIAACEAPRGILIHHYKLDKNGMVRKANIITPTAMNLRNLELDIEKIFPSIRGKPKKEIKLELEKLIRAYDPCISCSTHFLQLNEK